MYYNQPGRSINQRGYGVGSFLGGLYRQIQPFASRSAKPVGKELLSAGVNVLGDVFTRNVDVKKSLEDRLTESGHRLKRKAVDTIEDMVNNPTKYKRKRKPKKSQKGAGRRRTKKKRGRPKKTKKKTGKRKKKTRDVYDIFGTS